MNELWGFPAKGADDVMMKRHRRQPFGTANNVGDAHQVVINHGGQVVGGQTI